MQWFSERLEARLTLCRLEAECELFNQTLRSQHAYP